MNPVLGALLVGAWLPAAPGLKERPGVYFPTQVGATWVYENSATGEEDTQVVTRVADADGAKVLSVGRTAGGAVAPVRTVIASARGVSQGGRDGKERDPPHYWLRTPVKVGDKWEFAISRDVSCTRTVAGVEDVEVPAGRFRAVRVDVEVTERQFATPTVSTHSSWYAVGVGLVKQARDGKPITVLKSFTPGRD